MPRSVGITGSGQLDNVGSVRNMGIEADVQADVFSVGGVNFSLNVNGSVNSNVLLELAEGLRPPEDRFIKFVEGYPLYGQWDRPVLGWSDTNGDGVLQADEVQVGDSIIFIGNTNPTRMLNFTPMISLFNGTLHLSSLFVYRGGLGSDELQRTQQMQLRELLGTERSRGLASFAGAVHRLHEARADLRGIPGRRDLHAVG